MKPLRNLLKKEIDVVIKLEHDELKEFKDLSRKTLKEIENTRKEMKIEERIQINLGFVHFKLDKIHENVGKILSLISEKDSDSMELNHRIKSILYDIVDLESSFIPLIKENLKNLEHNESLVEQMRSDLASYEEIIKNLKRVFNLAAYSAREIKTLQDTDISKLKTHVSR